MAWPLSEPMLSSRMNCQTRVGRSKEAALDDIWALKCAEEAAREDIRAHKRRHERIFRPSKGSICYRPSSAPKCNTKRYLGLQVQEGTREGVWTRHSEVCVQLTAYRKYLCQNGLREMCSLARRLTAYRRNLCQIGLYIEMLFIATCG